VSTLVGGGRGGDVHQVCLEHIAREGGSDRVVVLGALVFGRLVGGDVGDHTGDLVTRGGTIESAIQLVHGSEAGGRVQNVL